MAKLLTAPAVQRRAMKIGAIPSTATVSRGGEVRWESDGLAYLGWISRDVKGALSWYMNVSDAKFGPLTGEYEGMSVPIRSAHNEFSWPDIVNDSLDRFLHDGLGQAIRFIEDRSDLCELLSSPEDVHRGDLYAWLPMANYPARLVQALVLARDIGAARLESRILDQLKQGPVELPSGRLLDIQGSAVQWSAIFSKALGFDIPID